MTKKQKPSLLVLCQYADKSWDNEHWDGRDMVFLIYGVTSREHMLKGLSEVMGGSPPRWVTIFMRLSSLELYASTLLSLVAIGIAVVEI